MLWRSVVPPPDLTNSNEEKLLSLEVLAGDIDDCIDKRVMKMKNDIWNIVEHHGFGEKGGSLGLEDESKEKDEKEIDRAETGERDIREEVFRDVIIKDKNKKKEIMKKLDIKRDGDKDERTKHELIQIPPTEKKKWPQKPCVYCRRKKVRRDTRYICSSCNAALCKDCFYNYHAKIKKYILI